MLRRNTDAALWWNMAGVLAVYQPVAAPGPLLARYNMAHGGDNRYRAADGVAPTWHGATGWTFDDAEAQYLDTQYTPTEANHSIAVRYSDYDAWASYPRIFGASNPSNQNPRTLLGGSATGSAWANGGGVTIIATPLGVSGVAIVGAMDAYLNGADIGNLSSGYALNYSLFIGGQNNGGSVAGLPTAQVTVQAFAIYARALSVAEVQAVSRQMAYCEKNPDWSVWARRRRWFSIKQATAYSGSVALGRSHAATGLGGATALAAITAGRTHTTTDAGAATALSSTTLGRTHAATELGTASALASVSAGRELGVAEGGAATALGSAALGRTHAASASGSAAALAGVTLARAHGVSVSPLRTVLGAVTLAIRKALALVGLQPPATPSWRIYTPPADPRTHTPSADSRTSVVED